MSDSFFDRAVLVALLLIVASCCLFNLFHGYHPTDDGFVLSASWRIFNGEIPYRDFLSGRTPLSGYLHSLWFYLPERWTFPAARASYFLLMGSTLILPLALLKNRLAPGRDATVFAVAVTLSAWLFSLHNFPPMPWTTIDGLFFSNLAVVLICAACLRPRTSLALLALGAVSAGLAPLAKQNFAAVTVWFSLAVLTVWRFRRDLRLHQILVVLFCCALPGLLLGGFLISSGVLSEALAQLRGASQNGGLWGVGFEPYLRLPAIFLILVCAALGWYSFSPRGRIFRWLPIVVLPLGFLEYVWRDNLTRTIAIFTGLVSWLVAYTIRWSRESTAHPLKLPMWILLSGAVACAWASSISLGFYFPLLGFTLLGFYLGIILCLNRPRVQHLDLGARALLFGSVVICLVCYLWVSSQRPYRDEPRALQSADLTEIFPRFGFRLTTHPKTYQRFVSLQQIEQHAKERYPQLKLVVVPQFPLFYFLSNRRNPTPVDWWNPYEYVGREQSLLARLRASDIALIVEMQDQACLQPLLGDPLIESAIAGATRIDSVGSFCVFTH